MIEVISPAQCIACDRCVMVCPANVFDARPGAPPIISRQNDCQTCFLCEIYCPTDALYVAPDAEGPVPVDENEIAVRGYFGDYARHLGWEQGKAGGADRDPTWLIRDLHRRAAGQKQE
ncbi:ferredoxin family protein [Paramixta manurensis]|uniref:Ferredoxin family protein n=1 Tax=Paramixta manurensis TaxID=2740817 RepID=A0A6M8UB13_9GAMM|nr:ferredoxin family protein [Erwiniaceae bacterium PD-1]